MGLMALMTVQSGVALKAKLFRGLADPARLSILEALSGGERCVSELVEETGLPQSTVSMHLGCLRDCGLVESRREGRRVYYRHCCGKVDDLLRAAERVLADAAEQVYACTRYGADAA